MKNKFTKKDVETFDYLLEEAELPGMGNYRRNMGRLRLMKFLEGFTQEAQDKMAKKIGARRIK